jgi:hypothetical protein
MKLPNPIDSLTFPWNYIAAGVAVLALVAAIVFGTVQCKRINQENTKYHRPDGSSR